MAKLRIMILSCIVCIGISETTEPVKNSLNFGKMAKSLIVLFGVGAFLASSVESKVYEPCKLAKEMVEKYRFKKEDLANWICLIRWESNFDTAAVGNLNADGSKDHGLFQISDKFWCVEGRVDGACGVDCRSLRDDDIKDDAKCARRIYRVTKSRTGNGFNAWAAWKQRCQNQNVDSYIADCNLNSNRTTT